MAEISFALLTSENLKKYGAFSIKQTEVIVEVTGDTDSSTLAKIRDNVDVAFKPLRDHFNNDVKAAREKIEEALKQQKSQVELKKLLGQLISTKVKELETKLNVGVKAACEKDEALKALVAKELLKMVVRTNWTLGMLVWDFTEGATAVGVAVTTTGGTAAVGLAIYKVIKACYGVIKGVQKIVQEFDDAAEEEAALRKRLKEALKDLKKYKPPAKVPTNVLTLVEQTSLAYPSKIIAVELSAKPLAGELDKLLALTEKAEFPDKAKKEQEQIEKAIAKLINQIIHINTYSASGKKLALEAKEAAKACKSRAATDWAYVYGVLDKFAGYVLKAESVINFEGAADLLKEGVDLVQDQLTGVEELVKD